MLAKSNLVIPDCKRRKILNTCVACRQRKIKCDASITKGNPCSQCSKKRRDCLLDAILEKAGNGHEIEKLAKEVGSLRKRLDVLVARQNYAIRALQSKMVLNGKWSEREPSTRKAELNGEILGECPAGPVKTSEGGFTIRSNPGVPSMTLSTQEAKVCFKTYGLKFNKYLPIFPETFFERVEPETLYRKYELLFWCVVLTSFLGGDEVNTYTMLLEHIKVFVQEKVSDENPNSVEKLSSLLVLTTWPLPNPKGGLKEDYMQYKYVTMMRNIVSQLNIRRYTCGMYGKPTTSLLDLEYNPLFWHRLYYFVHINSNHLYSLFGKDQDRSNRLDFEQGSLAKKVEKDMLNETLSCTADKYVNSMLRFSFYQQKIVETVGNECSKDNVKNLDYILISLGMFERVIDSDTLSRRLVFDGLTKLNLAYLRLQIYVYIFANPVCSIEEYRGFVARAASTCKDTIEIMSQEFGCVIYFNQLLIHYRSILELATIVLLRILYSPFLRETNDYEGVKEKFQKLSNMLFNGNNNHWSCFSHELLFLIEKTLKLFEESPSTFLNCGFSRRKVSKTGRYSLRNVTQELIYLIYSDFFLNNKIMEKKDTGDIEWIKFKLEENNPKKGPSTYPISC